MVLRDGRIIDVGSLLPSVRFQWDIWMRHLYWPLTWNHTYPHIKWCMARRPVMYPWPMMSWAWRWSQVHKPSFIQCSQVHHVFLWPACNREDRKQVYCLAQIHPSARITTLIVMSVTRTTAPSTGLVIWDRERGHLVSLQLLDFQSKAWHICPFGVGKN